MLLNVGYDAVCKIIGEQVPEFLRFFLIGKLAEIRGQLIQAAVAFLRIAEGIDRHNDRLITGCRCHALNLYVGVLAVKKRLAGESEIEHSLTVKQIHRRVFFI